MGGEERFLPAKRPRCNDAWQLRGTYQPNTTFPQDGKSRCQPHKKDQITRKGEKGIEAAGIAEAVIAPVIAPVIAIVATTTTVAGATISQAVLPIAQVKAVACREHHAWPR
jgi:non-ribosomal peptide synthetase component E (peptide arylation enzyme)